MEVLGIDIGGSGIKSAVVNIKTGELLGDRVRLPTPLQPGPEEMLEQIRCLVAHFAWKGPIGCGFPGVVRDNTILTAVNLHPTWVGVDLGKQIKKLTKCNATILNDADAAGLAEIRLGAGAGRQGVVFMITIGTGIGTALFVDGVLVPNTEIGHIVLPNGKEAESQVSEPVRKKKGLSWKQWTKRFDAYLRYLETLFWPNLFILGGGGAKKPEKILPHLTVQADIAPAFFRNRAGIIGAALYAET